jgi:PhzF family phenazine biosynthesis protein
MRLPIYQIDAFTNRPFGGNPAAVMPLEFWLPDALMQLIATENNLAETAFFVATPDGPADYHLRWFTPTLEIALCGHATLATADVLFRRLRPERTAVRFSTQSAGILGVSCDGAKLALDFPAEHLTASQISSAIIAAVGATPIDSAFARINHLLVLESSEAVRNLKPNFNALNQLPGQGVIVTAKGAGEIDFVSRYFAPALGVDEDPVTGSAHCALVPYWAARLGKTKLRAQQLHTRIGDLWCELKGDRVIMAGQCVEVLEGVITLPDSV